MIRPAFALFTISLAISACDRGPPAAPAGLFASAQARADGASLFAANCAICHGVRGDGGGQRREGMNPPPANLTLPPWSEEASAGRTFLAVRNGLRGTAMPPWLSLTDRQVWDIVAFIHSLKSAN